MTKFFATIGTMLMLSATIFLATAQPNLTANQPKTTDDPAIEWIHTFDSIINDRAYYVDQTADGGYVFTGSTVVTPPGYTELLLVKTDGNGEESWHHNFPMSEINLYGTAVQQTTDGGYIIVGSVGGTYRWDVQVTKADSNGDLVWRNSFGTSDKYDQGRDILQTSDGGYIVLGATSSYGQGSLDIWLIKLTADGTEQWNKTIGGATFEDALSFTQANDGGYVIVGQTDANDAMGDILVVKTNDAGDVTWQKTFGDSISTENAFSIKAVTNGYIILTNVYDANNTESAGLLRIDEEGTMTWSHSIVADSPVHAISLTAAKDGGYFITGSIANTTTFITDAYLLKLTAQGETEWFKVLDISSGGYDEATYGIQAPDNGFVAVGNTGSLNDFESDTFILKTEGNQQGGVVLDSVTARLGVQARVKNLGSSEATADVTIQITGGIFHHVNVTYQETATIPAGGDATVSCKPFLGLGPITVDVTVNGVTTEFEGKQIIILTQLVA
jgi:hypothetical protein